MAMCGKRKKQQETECRPSRSAASFLLICGLILGMGTASAVFARQERDVQIKKSPSQQQKTHQLKPPAKRQVVKPAKKAVPSGPQPNLVIEGSNKFDFGDIWGKKKVSHTFTLKNTGKAPLEIKSIKPG